MSKQLTKTRSTFFQNILQEINMPKGYNQLKRTKSN